MPGVSQFKRTSSAMGSRTTAKFNVLHNVSVTAAATAVPVGSKAMLVHVAVTSGNSGHIVSLPSMEVGKIVVLSVGANGFELSGAINGGSGTSTIAANKTAVCICDSATSWKAFGIASDGTTAGIEAAS